MVIVKERVMRKEKRVVWPLITHSYSLVPLLWLAMLVLDLAGCSTLQRPWVAVEQELETSFNVVDAWLYAEFQNPTDAYSHDAAEAIRREFPPTFLEAVRLTRQWRQTGRQPDGLAERLDRIRSMTALAHELSVVD